MRDIGRFLKEAALLARGLGLVFAAKYVLLAFACLPEVLLSRSLGAVDKRVRGMLNVTCRGFRFRFAPDALPAVREIFLHGCYGFDTSKRYAVVIDMGANQGTFSAMAAKVSARVIAVECNTTDLPGKFWGTMALNRIKNAIFVNRFIAPHDGEGTVSVNRLVRDFALDRIDFVKMDIEGAEKDLFRDNLEWLEITRQISMEVHPCLGANEQDIVQTLVRYGFAAALLDKRFNPVSALDPGSMGYIRASRP